MQCPVVDALGNDRRRCITLIESILTTRLAAPAHNSEITFRKGTVDASATTD